MGKKKERPHKNRLHQFTTAKRSVWKKLSNENKIDKIYGFKKRAVDFWTLIFAPFISLQLWLFKSKLEKVDYKEKPPLFILGHWRSGTTHLHYIMHKDPQYGTLSNFQNFAFNVALIGKGWLKALLSPLMPKKRPQDNVKVDADKPAEEEQPFSTMSTRSGFHSWYFARNKSYYNKYNLFEGISDEEKKAWQNDYVDCLRQISVYNDYKPLVLKNPHNTSRVKELVELFPNSKFIFIHRNPYDIFLSTRHLFFRIVNTQFLQYMSHKELDEMIFLYFTTTMKKYLAERHLIPKGNLVEIGYDDLSQNPYEQVDRIYNELNLPNYDKAFPHIDEYLKSVKNYKRNKFRDIKPQVQERILKEFKFAFDEWGYSLEK